MNSREELLRTCSRLLLAALVAVAPSPGWPAPPPASTATPVTGPVEIVSPGTVGEVVFPHAAHVEEFGLTCAECHHETRATALDKMPHQGYFADFWIRCSTCHRAAAAPLAPQACSTCHHSSLSDIADQTLSAKVALHRSCWKCHEAQTGEKATAHCSFCHNRNRIASPATGAAK
jgi:hypothetical protein